MGNYNRSYYSTKKQPSPLFYIVFSLVIVAIIVGGLFANLSQQRRHLTYNEQPVEQLTFEKQHQLNAGTIKKLNLSI